MNRLALLAALFAACAAQAQSLTASVTPSAPLPDTTPNLYRGTQNIGNNQASHQACVDAAVADALRRGVVGSFTYGCDPGRTSFTVRVAAAPAPAPSPSPSPAPAPSPAPSPAPAPAPAPAGPALYFSDCQAGAAPGCVAGANSNAGSEAAPKRDFTGLSIAALQPGTRLLLKRGGAWSMSGVRFEHATSTRDQPITVEAWGDGALPLWRATSGAAMQLGGNWGNTSNDGGYVLRNLRLQGGGTAGNWGVWLVQNVRDVTIENVHIEGFAIGVHASNGAPWGVNGLTVRNSVLSRNIEHGLLGGYSGATIEGNLFEGNNTVGPLAGSPLHHAIYLTGGNGNAIRDNRFLRNSVASGECRGGNVTAHGLIDGLVIENNLIEQDISASTCAGFSITAAYATAEAFRRVIVRGNTIVNVGQCAVCVNSAPGIVIEGNRSINQPGRSHVLAFTYGANEVPMTDPVVRNNVLCGAGSMTNLSGVVQGNRSVPLADAACVR